MKSMLEEYGKIVVVSIVIALYGLIISFMILGKL